MATSTNRSDPAAQGNHCRYRDKHSLDLLQRHEHDCRADVSFWCANRILDDVRQLEMDCRIARTEYYDTLIERFDSIVQSALQSDYEGAHVVWATREKPSQIRQPPKVLDPCVLAIDEVIFRLNGKKSDDGQSKYSTHGLLWALAQFAIGRSHVFSVLPTNDGAELAVYPLLLNATAPTEPWIIPVPLAAADEVEDFCQELRRLYSDGGDISRAIEDRIARWTASPEICWVQERLDTRLSSKERDFIEQHPTDYGFSELFKRARLHIALIRLYQQLNGFVSMSYVLAPTLQGVSDSSLVVYWPCEASAVPLHLLYLLHMILGQNATAILAAQSKVRVYRRLAEAREVSLVNYGHTVGHHIDHFEPFFFGPVMKKIVASSGSAEARRGFDACQASTRILKDLSVVLLASPTDNEEQLRRHAKRDRFLEPARPPHPDLVRKIREDWCPLLRRLIWCRSGAEEQRVWSELEVRGPLVQAELGECLTASLPSKPDEDVPCRLAESLYRLPFLELLQNALSHGRGTITRERGQDSYPVVKTLLYLARDTMPDGRQAMVLSNAVGEGGLPLGLRSESWAPWPTKGDGGGPAMATEWLRRLKLAEIWYRCAPDGYFDVAIFLKGMVLTVGD